MPLTDGARSPVRYRILTGSIPTRTEPDRKARVAPAHDTNGNQGRGSNHEESSRAHARRGQRGRDRGNGRHRDRGTGKKQGTSLSGAGSSFVFPLVSKWIPALGTAYGYQRVVLADRLRRRDRGDHREDGRLRGLRRTAVGGSVQRACKGCVQIPWALSATSIPYNLPGIELHPAAQRADPGAASTSARSRSGTIRRSGRSTASAALPDTTITPVYRSDNSGTTYNFTDYLSAVSPTWKSKFGVGVNAQWPAGIGAKGSSGVAGVLTKTVGAIGYVDVAYALKNKLRFASVQNASGKFATPGLRGIEAAAATLPKTISGNGTLSIVNPPKGNPLAYPISTFTYVIVSSGSSKAADLRKMIYWAVTQGQTFGKPLLFQTLPKQVQAFDYKQIKKIQLVRSVSTIAPDTAAAAADRAPRDPVSAMSSSRESHSLQPSVWLPSSALLTYKVFELAWPAMQKYGSVVHLDGGLESEHECLRRPDVHLRDGRHVVDRPPARDAAFDRDRVVPDRDSPRSGWRRRSRRWSSCSRRSRVSCSASGASSSSGPGSQPISSRSSTNGSASCRSSRAAVPGRSAAGRARADDHDRPDHLGHLPGAVQPCSTRSFRRVARPRLDEVGGDPAGRRSRTPLPASRRRFCSVSAARSARRSPSRQVIGNGNVDQPIALPSR